MKYLLAFIVIFLIIRLLDKENPLIGDYAETDLEYIAVHQPDKRPEGIPDNAVWRGGADGGVYVVLPTPVQGEKGIYYAEIYGDHSGTLWYKGRLKFIYSEYAIGEPIDPTRDDIIMGWDGERLHLRDTNQYLQALDLSDKD